MKVLVIYSDAPDGKHLRLDEEDRAIYAVARKYASGALLDRHHASQIGDIHDLLSKGNYDVVQFSGHGDPGRIYLCKEDFKTEAVSAENTVRLIHLAAKPPILAVFLSCYSFETLPVLAEAAPFVISSHSKVTDRECIDFVSCFYERLFGGLPIESSFNNAMQLMAVRHPPGNQFELSRRELIRKPDGLFIHTHPGPGQDVLLINLDKVSHLLDTFGMSRAELLHLLRWKLRVHSWIFSCPRENAIIPIGLQLFGQFRWEDKRDVIYCTKLLRLREGADPLRQRVWAQLLPFYNDLASSEYRRPNAVHDSLTLEKAVRIFKNHLVRFEACRGDIEKLQLHGVLVHIDLAVAECNKAADDLILDRYPEIVPALEAALTNLHTAVDSLCPPLCEETP